MNTKEQLIDILTKANASEAANNRIHQIVARWIAAETGKALNGWCEKRAQKFFDIFGWKIRFGTVCGSLIYLYIWGGDSGFTQQEPIRLFLGYSKDVVSLNVETFEEQDRCYGSAAVERINSRNEVLANDDFLTKASEAIDVYKAAKVNLEQIMSECGSCNEAYYPIKELSGLKQ